MFWQYTAVYFIAMLNITYIKYHFKMCFLFVTTQIVKLMSINEQKQKYPLLRPYTNRLCAFMV